jgi:ATP-dependent DNA helicase PIF1
MLRIGNGTEEVNEDGDVRLPDEICVSYIRDSEKDLDTLIESIFPNLNENMQTRITSPLEPFYQHVMCRGPP